jgi:uncharacterized metal-binding protein
MSSTRKVNIVPCSGIGKSFGSVSRLAAYYVTEDDRPTDTTLIPLALLVLGDKETNDTVLSNPSITLDGCKLQCAKKMIGECGGEIARDLVVLDVYRDHRDLKPAGIAELNEAGEKLARALADTVDPIIDQTLVKTGGNKNA